MFADRFEKWVMVSSVFLTKFSLFGVVSKQKIYTTQNVIKPSHKRTSLCRLPNMSRDLYFTILLYKYSSKKLYNGFDEMPSWKKNFAGKPLFVISWLPYGNVISLSQLSTPQNNSRLTFSHAIKICSSVAPLYKH